MTDISGKLWLKNSYLQNHPMCWHHTTNVDEFLNFKFIGNSDRRKEVIYKVYIHPLPLCCLQNGRISIKFNFYYIQFNAAHYC